MDLFDDKIVKHRTFYKGDRKMKFKSFTTSVKEKKTQDPASK